MSTPNLRYTTLVSLTLCTGLCAGCGTMLTRGGHKPFGASPYEAVCLDCGVFCTGPPEIKETKPEAWLIWSPSLIGDAVLDTVLLPVDLVLWGCGVHKDGLRM